MFAPSTHILVVDDAKTMRKIVIRMLNELGFTQISEAGDGAQAFEVLANANPSINLIISDWNMPVSTGLDLLKRVRSDSRFKNVPFMLATTEAEGSQVKEAVTVGVDNYLLKPFTTEGMREKLTLVYKKRFGG
jgi:two-component system chemotaxis response regulator CheY